MRLLTAALLTIVTSSGCYVYTSSDVNDEFSYEYEEVVSNYAPEVLDAEAGCYYDGSYRDDIWYFDAVVDDFDGLGDITQVWADVYDEFDGALIESFELYPTGDSSVWFSDWLGSSTYLDCFYRGYTVDVVAYDTFEDMDYMTIVPYTY